MKLKRIFSLLGSRGTRRNVQSADARIRGRKPTKLERSLSAEAHQAAQIAHDAGAVDVQQAFIFSLLCIGK